MEESKLREIQALRRKGTTLSKFWEFILNSPRHKKAWENSQSTGKAETMIWDFLTGTPKNCTILQHWEEENPGKIETSFWEILLAYPENIRNKAIKKLGELGIEAMPAVIKALESKNKAIRKSAILVLGKMSGHLEEANSSLLAILQDKDEELQKYALIALSQKEVVTKKAIPELMESLQNTDDEIRLYTTWSLVKLGKEAKEAIPTLFKMVDEEDSMLRSSAREAIRSITGEEFNDQEKQTMLTKKRFILGLVLIFVSVCGLFFEKPIQKGILKTTLVLTLLLEESDFYHKREVTLAMSRLVSDSDEPLAILIEDLKHPKWGVRARTAKTLAKMKKEAQVAIPALITTLEDENWTVRYHAAIALRELAPDSSVKAKTTQALENKIQKEKDEYVCRAINSALSKLKKPKKSLKK